MHATALKCNRCGWTGGLDITYTCPRCGYSLEVTYSYDSVDRRRVSKALENGGSVWAYSELLPLKDTDNAISMEEGNTPLIKSRTIGVKAGVRLYLKDETRNPTLSFKDRPNTVGISVAGEMGYRDVAIASTGNGAASLSAYSARGGLSCHVFVPRSTPVGKVAQALYHGSEIIYSDGDYSESFHYALKKCMENNWANITSTYINPYTMEGDKTLAYEIFSQLNFNVPDWIVVPLGAGPMLSGIWKGFNELRLLGFCDRLPRMIGVQAEGCAPIIDAFEKGSNRVSAWEKCDTVAGAIADPLKGYEDDGTRTLNSIRASGGYGVKVSDDLIMDTVKELAVKEAIFAEPASASSVSAVYKLKDKGVIKNNECVVSIITAHGLKDTDELINHLKK